MVLEVYSQRKIQLCCSNKITLKSMAYHNRSSCLAHRRDVYLHQLSLPLVAKEPRISGIPLLVAGLCESQPRILSQQKRKPEGHTRVPKCWDSKMTRVISTHPVTKTHLTAGSLENWKSPWIVDEQ